VQCCVWFAAVLGPGMLVLGIVLLVRGRGHTEQPQTPHAARQEPNVLVVRAPHRVGTHSDVLDARLTCRGTPAQTVAVRDPSTSMAKVYNNAVECVFSVLHHPCAISVCVCQSRA